MRYQLTKFGKDHFKSIIFYRFEVKRICSLVKNKGEPPPTKEEFYENILSKALHPLLSEEDKSKLQKNFTVFVNDMLSAAFGRDM